MATTSKKIPKGQITHFSPPTPIFQPLLNWPKIFGRVLMSVGAFIIIGTIFLTQMAYISPNKQMIVLGKETANSSYPTTITFENTSHTLEKANFKYGLWPLSDTKPVYLESSGTPSETGNIVIYGHNTTQVFANLHKLKEGSEVIISTNTSQTLIFKIDSIKKVFPQEVAILQQGSEERITLFTCTGLFDSMRFVVSGKRVF